jgi:Uma2 family endonuclease
MIKSTAKLPFDQASSPMVTLQLRQLDVPPGQRLVVRDLSWAELELILTELGDHRAARIAYNDEVLEIRMPLPKHERTKSILGDAVKILLEELEIDCECFGSTTFKRQEMSYGIEPDECFYIQNHQLMVGKDRVDLSIDPPPDLAIEVDVTSKTQINAYLKLKVAELWVYTDDELKIYMLQSGAYQASTVSNIFRGLPVLTLIQNLLESSAAIGRSQSLRDFRQDIRALL